MSIFPALYSFEFIFIGIFSFFDCFLTETLEYCWSFFHFGKFLGGELLGLLFFTGADEGALET